MDSTWFRSVGLASGRPFYPDHTTNYRHAWCNSPDAVLDGEGSIHFHQRVHRKLLFLQLLIRTSKGISSKTLTPGIGLRRWPCARTKDADHILHHVGTQDTNLRDNIKIKFREKAHVAPHVAGKTRVYLMKSFWGAIAKRTICFILVPGLNAVPKSLRQIVSQVLWDLRWFDEFSLLP